LKERLGKHGPPVSSSYDAKKPNGFFPGGAICIPNDSVRFLGILEKQKRDPEASGKEQLKGGGEKENPGGDYYPDVQRERERPFRSAAPRINASEYFLRVIENVFSETQMFRS